MVVKSLPNSRLELYIQCCYQYSCLCMRCCASIITLDNALVMMAEEKEKNLEVMRQAMGPDVSPRPGSEFDELDSRSVDSFLEAEDVPQDTVNHRRDAAAVALYSLTPDNTNTPGKFSGSNPTSKLSGSRSLEMTVDKHAYVTTRNGYNSSSTDGSSKKTSSKSKNSSSSSAQNNNQQGHHHHRNQQQQQGRRK